LAGDVPAYLLGALDAGTCNAVAEHLEDCPACKAEGRRISDTIGALGLLAPAAEPPADLRGRVLSSLQTGEPAAPETEAIPAGQPRRMRYVLAVAAILVVALLGWNGMLSRDLSQSRADLAALRQERIHGIAMLADASRAIPLVPKSDPDVHGMLYVSPDASQGLLMVEKLPPVHPGMVYQIWLIQGSEPVPATVFRADSGASAMVMIDPPKPLNGYQSLAITQEPGPAGSAAPTGPMVADLSLS
jgi:anti-sigma-K factor RskA